MKLERNRKLIALLQACAESCHYCSVANLEEEDIKAMVPCIQNNLDCAEMCTLVASYVSRVSQHVTPQLLNNCIALCEACAAECEKHLHMPQCKECAANCRACAEACKKVLSEGHGSL